MQCARNPVSPSVFSGALGERAFWLNYVSDAAGNYRYASGQKKGPFYEEHQLYASQTLGKRLPLTLPCSRSTLSDG